VANRDDAGDILQDIFYKIHLKRETIRDTSRLTGWIYQIARNAVTDYYRNAGRKNVLPEPEDADGPEQEQDPVAGLSSCLLPFLNQLSNSEKELMLQVDVKMRNQKKLAEESGVPYSTLKTQVYRTREKLRKKFLECCSIAFDKRGQIVDTTPNRNKCNC
jgi:RNA polymerase sigma-70 factor (ECF subfamily)